MSNKQTEAYDEAINEGEQEILYTEMVKALELIHFAVTRDADNNGGVVDRLAISEITEKILNKVRTL